MNSKVRWVVAATIAVVFAVSVRNGNAAQQSYALGDQIPQGAVQQAAWPIDEPAPDDYQLAGWSNQQYAPGIPGAGMPTYGESVLEPEPWTQPGWAEPLPTAAERQSGSYGTLPSPQQPQAAPSGQPLPVAVPQESFYPSDATPSYFDQWTPENTVHNFGGQHFVEIDSCYSRNLLDFQNRQTDKQLLVLCDGEGTCAPNLVASAQLRASFLAAGTNRANKFPYQGRFPTEFRGTSATDARLLHGSLAATGHFSPWAHGNVELLFSDVFTFPSFNQGSFQCRQAYATIGNFEASPWYAFIGKKTVSFGDMRTLSPFTQSMVWHYFNGLAEGVGGGFQINETHATVTALNGGRGIRVVDSQEIGQLNNFAANISRRFDGGPCHHLQIGAGWLHGTIYDSIRAEHIDTALFGERNPAWDVNAHLRLGRWQHSAEFASTASHWPVTGHKVIAWRGESAVDVFFAGFPARLSGSFSEGIQGDNGTPFEFNRQLVIGLGVYPTVNTQLSFEYVHSSGFAPLIDIIQVSDRDVHQHSFVLGLVLVL